MKWLLIVLLIQLDAEGKPGQVVPAQQMYGNEEDCMQAGEISRQMVPAEIISVATCIPESAFKAKAIKPLPEDKNIEEK